MQAGRDLQHRRQFHPGHAQQQVERGEHACGESEVTLPVIQLVRQQLHGPGPGQHGLQVGIRGPADRAQRQRGDPAAQPVEADPHQRLAQTLYLAPGFAEPADRRQLHELVRELRFRPQDLLDHRVVHVVVEHRARQPHHRVARGAERRPADGGRPPEEVALEQVEAQGVTCGEFACGLDLFGKQLDLVRPAAVHQRRHLEGRRHPQVDLHDVDQVEQLLGTGEPGEIVCRQTVSRGLQRMAPGEDLVIDGHGLHDLDHGLLGRQADRELPGEHAAIGVAEHVGAAGHPLDPEAQRAEDDFVRHLVAVEVMWRRGVVGALARRQRAVQEFVAGEFALAVEDGLTPHHGRDRWHRFPPSTRLGPAATRQRSATPFIDKAAGNLTGPGVYHRQSPCLEFATQ